MTETITYRYTDETGAKRRRSFDGVDDLLDFIARRRSAKRWRPEELRQEQRGRQTFNDYVTERWWREYALVELSEGTQTGYRGLWEAHVEWRSIASMPMGAIDAQTVVDLRTDLLEDGVGVHSVIKVMAMLQGVFSYAAEMGAVSFNPFKAVRKPSKPASPEVRPLTPMQVERLALDLDLRGYASAHGGAAAPSTSSSRSGRTSATVGRNAATPAMTTTSWPTSTPASCGSRSTMAQVVGRAGQSNVLGRGDVDLASPGSTVLDVYSHLFDEWRNRRHINIESEIRKARKKVWG